MVFGPTWLIFFESFWIYRVLWSCVVYKGEQETIIWYRLAIGRTDERVWNTPRSSKNALMAKIDDRTLAIKSATVKVASLPHTFFALLHKLNHSLHNKTLYSLYNSLIVLYLTECSGVRAGGFPVETDTRSAFIFQKINHKNHEYKSIQASIKLPVPFG